MSCTLLHAQQYVIKLKHWGVEDGLSHRQVNSVYQDSKGFIWLCTVNGLNRFDGYSFSWYTREKDSLRFDNVESVSEDTSGQMWCVARMEDENGVFLFNPYTHRSTTRDLKIPPQNGKGNQVYTLHDGAVLILTNKQTGLIWQPKSGYKQIQTPAGCRIRRYWPEKEAFLTISDSGQLMLVSPEGTILKTGDYLGVEHFNLSTLHLYGDYLITDEKKWYQITDDLKIIVSPALPPKQESFLDGVTDFGLDSIVMRQGCIYHPRYGLLKDIGKEGVKAITNIIVDKFYAGRFWIATEFGLYMLTITPNKFRQYFMMPPSDSKGGNSYRGILDDSGMLFACNESKGIAKLNLANNMEGTVIPFSATAPQYFGIIKLKNGNIVASTGNKLAIFRPEGKILSYHALPYHTYIGCWHMYEYSPGKLLLGVYGGLRWANLENGADSSFTLYNQFTEVAISLVLNIAPDKDGQIWFCCDRGFYMLDTLKGVTARYSSDDTGSHYLPSRSFQHFYQDANGIYWLATTDGLIRWDKAHHAYKLYTRADGLSNNNIYAIYPDNYGRLWLSSDYGIMTFDTASGSVKTYTEQDGISNNEFNRLSHFQSSNGNIYFGSLNGITAFDPHDFQKNKDGKDAGMLAVCAFHQFDGATNQLKDKIDDLLKMKSITLKPDDRFFNLEFALLNYADPQHTLYYWKINGIDAGWNVQHDRNIRLSRLPYGSYTLLIKAEAGDGSWSRNELAFQLNVRRPFYLHMGVFKFVKNRFDPVSDSLLNVYYYLTPFPKKSLRFEIGALTQNDNRAGSEGSISWRNRNTFKGAEELLFKINGGFEAQYSGPVKQPDIYNLGAEADLSFPRFVIPFVDVQTDSRFLPRSIIKLKYNYESESDLLRINSYTASYGYDWKEGPHKEHQLYPFNFTYVKTDTLGNADKLNLLYGNLIFDGIILGPTYEFTYNSQGAGPQRTHSFFFDGLIDLSGNILGVAEHADYKTNPQTLLGSRYAQYVKLQPDFRYYLKLSGASTIATRLMGGVGIPYGNSDELPNIKQFWAGGNSDLRGFPSRLVGPGTFNEYSIYHTSNYIETLGDMKMEVNLELRQHIYKFLNAAIFYDAGNIWLYNKNSIFPGGTFTADFYKQLAADVGFGLRFDFKILVLRLDMGMPVRDPWVTNSNGWVWNQIDFSSSEWRRDNLVLNIAIGYPF